MPRPLAASLAVLLLALPGGAAAWASPPRGGWRRPLPGPVIAPYSYDAAAPFRSGRRRGIDLAGPPGAPVLAACAGRVRHAGRVPGWGRGVTLRCGGGLLATELGLRAALVGSGARVRAGALVGLLGAGGRLRLGARRAGDRFAYLDPRALLGGDRGAPSPPPVAPAGRRGARRVPPPARRPEARPATAPAAHAPATAWAGLALLAAGAVGGSLRARRRRRAARAGAALAQR